MSEITKQDLKDMRDDIKDTFREILEAKFSALPCHQHDEALGRISAKADEAKADAQEAFTKASSAEVKAEFAKDAAMGHMWTLVKIGMASFMTAAGVKMSLVANWFGRISDALQHHKP